MDQPLFAFAEPPAPSGYLVIVAADRAAPLQELQLELDGRPLPYERWGDYFVRARLSPDDVDRVSATGKTARGEIVRLQKLR